MLGRGEIDQPSAQAAAWHLTDKLSWQELVQKVRVKHFDGRVEMYFNQQQLSRAAQIVAVATVTPTNARVERSRVPIAAPVSVTVVPPVCGPLAGILGDGDNSSRSMSCPERPTLNFTDAINGID